MTHTTPRPNQLMEKRLLDAAGALGELSSMRVEVLNIDLSQAIPLLSVRPNQVLKESTNASTRSRRGTGDKRIEVKRSTIARCFVEWEVQP